ncbi:transcriptional regulator [Marinobacterium nitratireducens]|uniref:Transcriptional regulator n=1 Tax=Marinobacterium nitratireducens TaxID=518897 RepID=A0A918DXE9_9GAMM|nr:Rrf2 family transcriptional regulator [Marinobacterium nitratireducens]GGO87100.1 transcriptional regulator [Marinobacterium nitratireducens]
MQLSRFTDYTLRVLFYVAMNNDRLSTLNEIADFYGISVEHLRKVVHALAKSGYLKTFRGKHGGIRLNRTPEDINVGAVVLQAEGAEPLIDCSGLDCTLSGVCNLQRALADAQRAFMQELNRHSLADMLDNTAMKQRLIGKAV